MAAAGFEIIVARLFTFFAKGFGYDVKLKCMTNQAKNPISPPNKVPVAAIAIISDDRVLAVTRDPMPSPMSVQPRPARKPSMIERGSISGDTAERPGADSAENQRTTLVAMNARPAATRVKERRLETLTSDN